MRSLRRVGGGDINDAYAAELEDGGRAFVKTRADAPAGEYADRGGRAALARRAGRAGRARGARRVRRGARRSSGSSEGAAGDEAELGRGLAVVHRPGADELRRRREPLRIGPLALPNEPLPDWPSFYAERRLRPLLAPARDRGSLSAAGARAVESVCERIADLAGPPEPPARLHGDLWSGNVLWSGRRPYVIDPVAYGGHREVDLAMLRLFGSPGPRFLAAYEEVAPLADGHEERVALYQLFPLLVHAVLFGGGYGSSVERAARRY